jgi:hypothetical protein
MRELILIEILAMPAERSRGRHNPRVVKRKMSSFPTKVRAAPPPGQVFRYEEHIRIVAPVGPPADQGSPPSAAPQEWTGKAPDEKGLSADRSAPVLAGACPLLARQQPVAHRFLRTPQPEPERLPSMGSSFAPDVQDGTLTDVRNLKSTVLGLVCPISLPRLEVGAVKQLLSLEGSLLGQVVGIWAAASPETGASEECPVKPCRRRG